MVNYQNTVMYKIICNDLEITDLYVGSTTDFRLRQNNHKSRCINENNPKHHFKIYENINLNGGWDNWLMVKIEKYPCNNKN